MTWLPDLTVLEGLALVGATSGALGCFAFLRRQSLLSDTLAHAALPGVCLAFLLTGLKHNVVLLTGALIAGILGSLLFLVILRNSRLKQDVALGIVLTTFFGAGVVLLSLLQGRIDPNQPNVRQWLLELVNFQASGQQSGLKHFIFGQAAYLTEDYVVLMRILGSVVMAALVLFYKELKLLSFDPEYAATLGYPRRVLELVFAALIVAVVMLSLRAVGVVLTVALLVAPAAAARQWTERLSVMIVLAMFLGMLSGVGGAFWSRHVANSPTGPVVVLCATVFLGLSLLVAPARGLLWSWFRVRRHRHLVQRENLLTDFYRLGERQRDWQRGRTPAELASVRAQPVPLLAPTLRKLAADGYATREGTAWRLTPAGLDEAARVVRNHRLWELYLAKRLDLALDHVHRDAEAMEHALPPEVVAELEEVLENPDLDPHGHPIPHASGN
jgi:manganese/zinc/iron transport system permease protein